MLAALEMRTLRRSYKTSLRKVSRNIISVIILGILVRILGTNTESGKQLSETCSENDFGVLDNTEESLRAVRSNFRQ